MAYATLADLKRYFDSAVITSLTTDRDGNAVDVAAVLSDASAELDAALRAAGFAVPLTAPYGGDVVALVCRLAVGTLLARRPEVMPPEQVLQSVRSAREELLAVARRQMVLTGSTPSAEGGSDYVTADPYVDSAWTDWVQ